MRTNRVPIARPFPLPVYGRCWRVHLLERAPCSRWPRRSCLATIGLRQAHVNRSNAASIRSASDRDSRCSTTTTLESCPGGTSASSRSVSVSARPSTRRKRRFRAIRTSAGVAISNTVYPLSVWLQQSRRPNHLTLLASGTPRILPCGVNRRRTLTLPLSFGALFFFADRRSHPVSIHTFRE